MTTNAQLNHALFEKFLEQFGYAPDSMHCLVTGKPIGLISAAELFDTLDLIRQTTSDDESVMDDYRMRLVAAMRPSTRWNKFREETLETMRERFPVELAAYLLNRLAEPKNKIGNIWSVENRIYVYQHCETLHTILTQTEWDDMIHMLLTLDIRTGLVDGLHASINRDSDPAAIPQKIRNIFIDEVKRWERLDSEARYIRHNPMAKRAFFESTVSTKAAKAAAKPKTEKQLRAAEFESMLDSIMRGEDIMTHQVPTATSEAKRSPDSDQHTSVLVEYSGDEPVARVEPAPKTVILPSAGFKFAVKKG